MIKFKSNKKAMFLKYFGVHIEPVYDIETNTVLWLTDETDTKYMDVMMDYVDCTRGYREVYIDYTKWNEIERELREMLKENRYR